MLWNRAPVGIVEATPAGVITSVNDALLSMLGRTREALVGAQAATLADPRFTPEISAGVAKLLAGQQYEAERHYLHADGHSVPVHVWTAVLNDDEGRVARMVGFVVDTTDEHAQRDALGVALAQGAAAKAELERRQAFTDALLDTVDVGIVSADAAGEILMENRAMRTMLGLGDERWTAGLDPPDRFEIRTQDGAPLSPEQFPLACALRGEPVHGTDLRFGPVGRWAVS